MAQESEPRGAQLFRNLTLAEVLGTLGWVAVALALVVLSGPMASLLFSVDGRGLRGEVTQALEWGRLLLGVTGLVLTFAGCDDPSVSQEEQRRRLRYVLDQVPPLDVKAALEGMSLYRQKTRQVAEEERAPLFDLAAVMTKDPVAYADTVHFSPRGEHEVAEHVAAALHAQSLLAPGAMRAENLRRQDHLSGPEKATLPSRGARAGR